MLESLQRIARLDPQLLHEHASCVLVDLERLRLTAGAIEREHQLPAQALLQRMRRDQHLELPDHVRVMTERELRVDPLDNRTQVKLLEPTDFLPGERFVREVGERRPSTKLQRFM